jgi:predicted MPP superfamily phosphohydrolase
MAAVGAGFGTMAHGYLRGHRRLRITRLDLPIPGLPPALDGLRLAQVSDLHVGPLAHRGALREAFARVMALDPDVVCVTGDIADSPATDLAVWVPELARLRARHGVFVILGNHDREAGVEEVARALVRGTAWRLLRDEVAPVEIGGARLHIVGLEDRASPEEAHGLPALLATIPAGEPRIVLAHKPCVFEVAAVAGVPLTLAGHTHGGQMAFPGMPRLNPARFLMSSFDGGTYSRAGALLHVSRGLGVSGQRVRVGVPREIALVTLRAVPPLA